MKFKMIATQSTTKKSTILLVQAAYEFFERIKNRLKFKAVCFNPRTGSAIKYRVLG